MSREIEIVERKDDDVYAMLAPFSGSMAAAVKNFLQGPSTMEAYITLRREVLLTRKELRFEILRTAVELAKVECLSDEKFRLLMLAFSQQ